MQRLLSAVDSGQVKFDQLGDEGAQAMRQVATAAKGAEKQILATAAATANFEKTVKSGGKEIKLTAFEAQNLSFQLQDLIVQIGSGQGIFRPLLQQGPQIVQIFGSVGNTFRFFGQQALRAFRSLLTLRAGLILLTTSVVALIAIPLIVFFARSEKAAQGLQRVLSAVGAAFDVIIDRAAAFGQVLVDFIQGQASFRDVTRAATDAVRGFGKEVSETARRAFELKRELQQLEEAQRRQTLIGVELQRQADASRARSQSQNATIRERISLTRQAASLEQEVARDQITLLDRRIAVLREAGRTGQEFDEAVLERNRLLAQTEVARITAQNEITALIQQNRQAVQALRDEYEKLLSVFDSPAQAAERAYSDAIEKIGELRTEARRLGVDLDFGRLEDLTRLQFERAKDAALGELAKLPEGLERQRQELTDIFGNLTADFVDGPGTDFEQAGRDIADKIARGAAKGLRQESIIEEIRTSLARAFDLTDAQLDFIGQQAGQVIGAIVSTIDATTQAQIAQQDRLLEAIRTRIDETQRLLDQELRRQEAGYANNVDALKARLEEENKAREEAERRRLDLERKAANQRLLINSAEQVSNYILAITKLTAAEAGKGLIGIFTAVAGVALLASIIARARANARQFQQVEQFREGTPFVDGPGHGKSDSIPARLSRGERVVPADINAGMGGRQVSNEELARLFSVGRLFEQRFPGVDLERLRPVKAPAVPMADVGAILRDIQRSAADLAQMRVKVDLEAQKAAYRDAANAAAQTMIDYWKTRPTEWIDSDGVTVYEREQGGKIERKRIKK